MDRNLFGFVAILCIVNTYAAESTVPAPTTVNAPTPTVAATTVPPSSASTSIPTPAECNTYTGGALFVAIIFGMVLMFGLTQLYGYWLKKRQEETNPGYRGY